MAGMDYNRKEDMHFISMIRLPDFVTEETLPGRLKKRQKEKTGFSRVEFFTYDEGICVQCMHIGPYDNEPATVEAMHKYANSSGYELDITNTRYHHEIYLSDPRKCDASKLKTVIRNPVRKVSDHTN